jgi:oxygen-independent coproporphyrinogen-3 oxidase
MLNALRLVDGFDAALFSERTGLAWDAVDRQIASLVERGLLLRSGARLRPSPQGLRFLNELLLTFVSETVGKSAQMAGPFGLSTAS